MGDEEPEYQADSGSGSREVRVAKTATGKGVFTRRWYRADMVVGEIEGEVIADANYGSEYCFDLENGSYLEPEGPFRFLNHSCQPNCEFEVLDLADSAGAVPRRRLMLSAIEDIKPGAQLTINYNWPIEGAIPCRCGASQCRGWVVAEAHLDEAIRRHAAATAPVAECAG